MKHRYAVLGAVAIGLMIAFLLVGRVRASEPMARTWGVAAGATWQGQIDGARPWTADADILVAHRPSTRPAVPR